MVNKLDLETKIYLILSDELGHSLTDLAKDLNVNPGNLSKKLSELREERKTIYRTSQEDDSKRPHYIKDDLKVFRQILKKLSKHLESAPSRWDPRRTYSVSDEFGDFIVPSSVRLCQLIDKFIKSEYTLRIIRKSGFETTYIIFKEETNGLCDILTYVELAEDLKKRGIISEKDLGEVFLADLQKKMESQDEELENELPFKSLEICSDEFLEYFLHLRR
jgi:Mn-dependent DtxR family transcriptional regulator